MNGRGEVDGSPLNMFFRCVISTACPIQLEEKLGFLILIQPRRVRISFLSVKYVPFVNVLNVQREGRKTGKGNIWTAKMILRNRLI